MVGHRLGEFAPTRTFKGHPIKTAQAAAPAPGTPGAAPAGGATPAAGATGAAPAAGAATTAKSEG